MKLSILCNDGSPLNVHYSDIAGSNGRLGVGGAELALLTVAKHWTDIGWDVTLYNNPTIDDGHINQKPLSAFDPQEERDVLVIFRSPNARSYEAKGKKVWWSCDQFTIGDFKAFSKTVDEIVTISPFHSNHFLQQYGIEKTTPIDIPVRIEEYQNVVEKKRQFMFCSVPSRGLEQLSRAWSVVENKLDDVNLVITSSWSLWDGRNHDADLMPFKLMFAKYGQVDYRGAVTRQELIKLQMESSIHAFPNIYDELYCISCAEMETAGAYPITSNIGALQTTNMGLKLGGHPNDPGWADLYGNKLVEYINDPNLPALQREIREKAIKRFDIKTIHEKWVEVFNG